MRSLQSTFARCFAELPRTFMVERELDAMLDGAEAMSLRDAAQVLGVRVNSLRKRLPAQVTRLRQHAR